MSALRSAVTAASASSMLPWILAGAIAAAVATAGGGFWAGHHWAALACDADVAASQLAALQHQAAAVAKAQATSDRIWSGEISLTVDLAVIRQRATARTTEVTAHVAADPDLSRSRVPDAVQRVRADQVRESQELPAGSPVRG